MSLTKSITILTTVLFSILLLQMSGCSWVKLTPEGELVQVAKQDEIASCKKVGKTTVSLKAKIVGVKRKVETVEGELRFLARNSAAKMGGDTVLAVSEIKDGEKTFEVYQCK